ncbi:unnamed protein product [Cochlearia groenlandica]
MNNSNVLVKEDNQVNEEKPPPRVCPRCNSNNTKFCYYNNYSMSQPRYTCKNCRRFWTHGGALRNIPVGGSGRKTKRTKLDQPSISNMVSIEIQQLNNYRQPFLHVQETNDFRGSSSSDVGNIFSSLSEIYGDMLLPSRNFRPIMDRLDFSDVSLQQDCYDVGSNDLIVNPLINQSLVVSSDLDSYRVNQEDLNKWNQSFNNNTMNMNHNANRGSFMHNTSGDRGASSNGHMNIVRNTFVFRPTYHFEKHGP